MSSTLNFAAGGYRYIPGVFQYSGGVAAEPGFSIERVRFAEPVPLKEGFERIAGIIRAAGRPLASFCACELRSPEPFTEAGFRAFNETYVGTLAQWELYNEGRNPVARSNVCPELAKPAAPSFHAFAYTVERVDQRPSYVVAGSGEAPEGKSNYRDHMIRRGDTSIEGLTEKAQWVLDEMERRMKALGGDWSSTTGVQVYTVHDLHPFLASQIVHRGAARHGLTWHYCRPPVVELEYEMDCRAVATELVA